MIEAVHTLRTHSGLDHIAVPTLPDGSRSVVDGIQPARILSLEKKFVSDVCHAVFCKGRHQDGCAEEAGLEASTVLLEVVTQARNHVFLCLTICQLILQCEQRRGLHCVQYLVLECAVSVEVILEDDLFCFLCHYSEWLRIPACCSGHFSHHACVDHPV